ncbi:MAG: hypothetical protein K2Q10_08740 [Rhodospirillales bacterium]|nr:hypothetical protein [Rhodospirillales bacterium]
MKRSAKGNGTRRTTTPINVWCLPSERAEIEVHAEAAGMSLSAYLRAVGAGYQRTPPPRTALWPGPDAESWGLSL